MRDLTPKPAEWIDRAPVKFRASREIAATPEEVWSALCDHERWPVWFSALSGAGATGGEGIGSTRFVMVGKDRIDETFVIWDEPRSWGSPSTRPKDRLGGSAHRSTSGSIFRCCPMIGCGSPISWGSTHGPAPVSSSASSSGR